MFILQKMFKTIGAKTNYSNPYLCLYTHLTIVRDENPTLDPKTTK